ncbi:Patched domain-containing protein 3 [Halocaridina rubra]|uniref:Patched domain-containing protein 3 n=1 Tax=Halocaridina rubra TaxID=373956 RepID=A0AAN8XES9_HALRR
MVTLEDSDDTLSEVSFKKNKCQCQCLSKISEGIVSTLESGFYYYGKAIGKYPFVFIILCLVVAGASSVGFLKYSTDDSELQFMSTKSIFREVLDWQERNFPSKTHQQIIIFEAYNVLDKDILLEMLEIRDQVLNLVAGNLTWETVCFKSAKDHDCDEKLPSKYNSYCAMQESMEKVCLEESILAVWNYDLLELSSRSQEEILTDINSFPELNTTLRRYLGGINQTGSSPIEGAKTAIHTFYTDSFYHEDSLLWEQKFSKLVPALQSNTSNISLFYSTSSSFGKIVSQDIQDDLKYLFLGILLVFFHVTLNISKCNLIENRPLLAILGLSCIAMATIVSYGLCSALDIPFGAINTILPFLLLGLGVDDMFVIISAFENISEKDLDKDLHERIGIALKHAGVSITITSVTNFLAFAIGATTVLPGLRSFCIYAAIGIAAVYFFQATFFVACLTLDQRRVEDTRHFLCCCWKIENWTPEECSDAELCKAFFLKVYADFLLRFRVRIFVLFLSTLVFGFSCWGVSNLKQDFDPKWFLPPNSSLAEFLGKMNVYYPSSGDIGAVYFSNVSYLEFPKLQEMVSQMRDNQYISRVNSWFEAYSYYNVEQKKIVNIPNQTESEFLSHLESFLRSCEGSEYRKSNFRYSRPENCSSNLPPIIASRIDYVHDQISGTTQKMKAIREITSTVKKQNFSEFVFPFSRSYINWETNYIIGKELLQNMGLALIMVFVVTLILLASLPLSLMVMLSVLMTLVDVGALMHWWGLTIDTISAIDLVLAIGLSVDYAVHIAHTFMTVTGTRSDRTKVAVGIIGPAVFNGGLSTFLSFLLLAQSDSYVFRTFYKIFFSVCLYGVFHGLVFLPVILSWLGPAPYATARPSSLIAGARPTTQVRPPSIIPHI